MEVFVELDAIAPVRILLIFPRAAIDGPAAILVAEENAGQTTRDFFGHLVEVHSSSGAGGTLDRELVTVISVILTQSRTNVVNGLIHLRLFVGYFILMFEGDRRLEEQNRAR